MPGDGDNVAAYLREARFHLEDFCFNFDEGGPGASSSVESEISTLDVVASVLQQAVALSSPDNLDALGRLREIEDEGPPISGLGGIALKRLDRMSADPALTHLREFTTEVADNLAFWLAAYASTRLGEESLATEFLGHRRIGETNVLSLGEANYRHTDQKLAGLLADLCRSHHPLGVEMWSFLAVEAHLDAEAGAYSSAAFLCDVAARLAPDEIEPHLMRIVSLFEEYFGADRPTEEASQDDHLQELEDLFRRIQALADDPGCLARFQNRGLLYHYRWGAMVHQDFLGDVPRLVSVSALAKAYVKTGRFTDARRLLQGSVDFSTVEQAVDRAEAQGDLVLEMEDLLWRITSAVADGSFQAIESSMRWTTLGQDIMDGLRAIVRRQDLQISLGAKEIMLVDGLQEMLRKTKSSSYPHREAEVRERLAVHFGVAWSALHGNARTNLETAEVWFDEMEPTESGAAAAIARCLFSALEALLQQALAYDRRDGITLGKLVWMLREFARPRQESGLDPAGRRVWRRLRDPQMKAHESFWCEELPQLLQSPDFDIIELRNAAVHVGKVTWQDLRRLREYLLGYAEPPGLIKKVLDASGRS